MQVLRRIDPARNMSRFYALDIVASLFGEAILVRRWGRIGSSGQRLEMWIDEPSSAQAALDRLVRAKTRRGYLQSPPSPAFPFQDVPRCAACCHSFSAGSASAA